MIHITDAHLTDSEIGFRWMFELLQAELDVAVFSGSNCVVVTAGPTLALTTDFEVKTSDLNPIEIPGLFEGVLNDLYLSRLFASWTTERGGALRLRAMFDEEGVELRGGLLDVDFDHVQLDVFFLPSLDARDAVIWDIGLAITLDGGVLPDLMRGEIEAQVLSGEVVEAILEALEPVKAELNQRLGLADQHGVDLPVRSIVIEEGQASFDTVSPFTPRYSIVFDAVEVHDDTDGSGQGELLFAATVAGIDVGSTEVVSAASGTVVPLEGSSWRISPTLQAGISTSLRFEAFDLDGDKSRSLGIVNVDLDPDDAPLVMRLTANTGKYTLLARLEPRGDFAPPEGDRHLRVSIPNVRVLHDHDAGDKGEVRFWALAAGQPTRVSDEIKVNSGDDPVDLPLTVDIHLAAGDDLDLRVVGWDVDPSQHDWLGEIATIVRSDAIDGTEELVRTSDTGDYEATIRIVDLAPPDDDPDDPDQPDDPPVETVRRLVVLETVTVRRDGDDIGPGDLRITVTLNDQITLANELPIETAAGALLPLVGDQWRAELDVPVAGTLSVHASVVDVDVTVDNPQTPQNEASEVEQPLGSAELTFDAGDDHGLGAHEMADSGGDVVFGLRILDPTTRQGAVQAMVRFEEVEIRHDHAVAGRGSLWCAASVKGFPLGDDTPFKAGNGDSIVLQGEAWTAGVGVDRDELAGLLRGLRGPRRRPCQPRDRHRARHAAVAGRPPRSHVGRGRLRVALSRLGPHGRRSRPAERRVPRGHGARRRRARERGRHALHRHGRRATKTELSVLRKARTGETLPLVGLTWTLEPQLDADDELTVTFAAYAEDADALARLDRVEQRFSRADGWGLGEHLVTSPDEKFRVRYAIAPADPEATPDLPALVPLLVEFTTVDVHDDGDAGGRGEVSFSGRVNGVTVLQTEQLQVDSGETVSLGAPLAPRTVWLQPDQDLEIELTASEHDGHDEHVLGTSRRVHSAAAGWDLGVHEVRSPGGTITATWRVDRADGPRARVKFLHVHVFDDDEPVKRGDLVCDGALNDVSTGPSLRMKARSDSDSSRDDYKSDIFLGGPRWTKTVSYDPDDVRIQIGFTVTEQDGLSPNDPLGSVPSFDASDTLDKVNSIRIFTELADSGKFEVTFLIQALS